jgi:hypothetical protein
MSPCIAEVHKVPRPENEQLRNDSKRQVGKLLPSKSHVLCASQCRKRFNCMIHSYWSQGRCLCEDRAVSSSWLWWWLCRSLVNGTDLYIKTAEDEDRKKLLTSGAGEVSKEVQCPLSMCETLRSNKQTKKTLCLLNGVWSLVNCILPVSAW